MHHLISALLAVIMRILLCSCHGFVNVVQYDFSVRFECLKTVQVTAVQNEEKINDVVYQGLQ